jgi:hypothetical protein
MVICVGGASALVLAPAMTGKVSLSTSMLAGVCLAVVVLAAGAAVIKYLTGERLGEAMESAND